jgi:hypothetical protein
MSRRIEPMPVRTILIAVGLFLVATQAGFGEPSSMPAKYRYAGWMVATEQRGGWPTHLLVEGDAGTLRFADRWNLTKKPVAYRVCVRRNHARVGPCKVATAPISTRPSVVPMFVSCCGDFVAYWHIAGRLVASWPFRYVAEHS